MSLILNLGERYCGPWGWCTKVHLKCKGVVCKGVDKRVCDTLLGMLCAVTSAKHAVLYEVTSAKHALVSLEKIWMRQMGILYWLHSFPLACLIFSPWVHATSPHSLAERIFLHTCVLCHCWPRLMAGTWTMAVYLSVLGGFHNFMILFRFGFHKVIYKRVWFSLQKHLIRNLHQARVSTFFILKLTSVLTMPVFEILKTAGYPLPVLTNQVFFFLKINN
jgi:hypothetical protein